MSTWSHGLVCDVICLFITLSTISKKLQDDGETITTTQLPATHLPDILSKETEASRSKGTSQTQLVGGHRNLRRITCQLAIKKEREMFCKLGQAISAPYFLSSPSSASLGYFEERLPWSMYRAMVCSSQHASYSH